MHFTEHSKQHFMLSQGAISFTVIDFIMQGTIFENGKEVVHSFINFPEDFEPARKYFGGYQSDHTNEFGKREITQIYGFGPYLIDLLELDDYKKIPAEEFENISLKMLSEYSINNEIEYIKFIGNVKEVFKNVKKNSQEFYLLIPSKSKYNDNSNFQLSDYLCGFAINRVDKLFTVIQIDDD